MSQNRPQKWPAKYSDDYRHFDGLVWQMPAWSTAVFAAVLSGFVFVSSSDMTATQDTSELYPLNLTAVKDLPAVLLGGGLFFLVAAYYTLFRLRVHQTYTERENCPRPFVRWLGAQTLLQLVIGVQTGAIAWLLLLVCNCRDCLCPWIVMVSILSLTVWSEGWLRSHRKTAENLTPQGGKAR